MLLDRTKNHKLLGDLLFNYTSILILAISGICINVILARNYNPQTLGVFNQVLSTYIIFGMLGSGGINYSTLRTIAAHSTDLEKIASIIRGAIYLTFFVSLVVTSIYLLLIEPFSRLLQSESVAIGMRMAFPGIFFFSINKVLLNGIVNGLQRLKAFAIYQSLRYIFILTSLILAIKFEISGDKIAIVFSSSEILLSILLFLDISFLINWFKASDWIYWFKRHFFYGYKSFTGGLLIELNTKIDILIIGIFLSDKEVGIYTFAAFFAEGFTQLLIVVQNIYNPTFANLLASHKTVQLKVLINKVKKITYFISIPIGILSIAIYPAVCNALTNNIEFQSSNLPFLILICGILISSGYIPFNNILLMANLPAAYSKLVLLVFGFNTIANFLLIPHYALVGASISTGLAFIFSAIALRVVFKRYIDITI